ncbi:hypothetical protein PV05_10858 [Exophiala xenobiotica]|uniref:Exosome complex protein n=1 Tax=Exophiala xenobiotica TaxID=348802 RepID=A0A0D2EMR4_9EURO|nr:uncharacterized protein PV05_10858 [Exophiala xenobiotica]KIW49154.1 hypothetical protein PV05_10858 [Exophiala xenobiotica]
MDTKSVLALAEQLEDNIEDLEDSLGAILETDGAFAATTKKLPLLERAKLNVLVVYAIESLLFSYLKLHGVDAKEHAVFRELTRVKQYFEKIKTADADPTTSHPTVTLNKEAAGRVIKHALAGNTKYDLKRAEREAREKVRANKKLTTLESSMQEKAKGRFQNEQAEDEEADALQLAAQLASVPQPESPEGSSASQNDSEGDDDDEGILRTPDVEDEPTVTVPEVSLEPTTSQKQSPPQQRGKKRKSQQSEEQQPVKKSQKADKKARKKERPARKAKTEAQKQAKKDKKKAAGGSG